MRLRYLIGSVAAVALLVAAPAAHASFPGTNGKIAYSATGANVYTVEPDGTGAQQLVPNAGSPAWSPDGKQIAYGDASRIWIANADGSQPHVVLDFAADPYGYAIERGIGWSPDGQKLVVSLGYYCADCLNEPSDLFTIGVDGSNAEYLPTSGYTVNSDPDWSPDGRLIAFFSDMNTPGSSRIFTIKPDGTGVTQVSNTPATSPSWSPDGQKLAFDGGEIYSRDMTTGVETKLTTDVWDSQPAWSPDGTRLTFAHGCPSACSTSGVYTIRSDGSVRTQITSGANDQWPNWQPIPQTYARPKGATPFKTFLVVAYKPCTAPDRTHGAPLAFPSCAPPQQASGFLTVGTGDANGAEANSVDSVRYDVHPGNPATAADEADVAIQIALRDIRNRSDLSDYTGELQLTTDLRITDRDNTPNPGGPGPGTVQDAPLSATVQCAATADTTTGSVCNLATSADALYPGAVKEGRRAIWQLGQVRAYDGGPDGVISTTAGNTLFMDEGVFVP